MWTTRALMSKLMNRWKDYSDHLLTLPLILIAIYYLSYLG